MAAQIYKTAKGAFEDAPTPQIYDAAVGAYKDSTGLVHDTSKGAWDERWGGVTAYVYGAALETITIKRNGITVGQVGTDANGKSTEQIRLACGTYDLTGSVSGWTEMQAIDKDTKRFRAMPEGALYWYGNECEDLSGGWTDIKVSNSTVNPNGVSNEKKINELSLVQIKAPIRKIGIFYAKNKIVFNKYTKLKFIGKSNLSDPVNGRGGCAISKLYPTVSDHYDYARILANTLLDASNIYKTYEIIIPEDAPSFVASFNGWTLGNASRDSSLRAYWLE